MATLRETLCVTPPADHLVERADHCQGDDSEPEANERRAGDSLHLHQF
jgi:hypothetical protein